MLAYVFLHWKQPTVLSEDYESRQRAFHRALLQEPPRGFLESYSFRVSGLPWTPDEEQVYEDWYLVEDFAALGDLNQAAISSSRAKPHERAFVVAAGGAGGLYRLKQGARFTVPRNAYWFGKPVGMSYDQLFSMLRPLFAGAGGALWMRQLVLGPGREFVLHAPAPVVLSVPIDPVAVAPQSVWPGPEVG